MPRPVNLDLRTFSYPVTAIASILHRLSGILLFIAVPFLLWIFYLSLVSSDSFNHIVFGLEKPVIKAVLWAFLTALIYHSLAGIRHFIMDVGYGESLPAGRMGAYLTIILTVIFAMLLGICLW